MPLPTTDQELSFLHTNMRASFVQFLYSIENTPRPVVWATGPKGESRQLPRMPGQEFSQPASSSDTNVGASMDLHADHAERPLRRDVVHNHGHAMGDDAILFHLQLILDKYQNAPSASESRRRYVILPPLILHQWRSGDDQLLLDWMFEHLAGSAPSHVLAILWMEQHWIPFWIVAINIIIEAFTSQGT